MKIDVTFDASAASAPAGFEAVVDDVAAFYDSEFSNPITLHIYVGWGEVDNQKLSADTLGESAANFANTYYTYAQVRSALIASAQTSQAEAAVATLPATDPTRGGTFSMTTAEAKALGLLSGSAPVIDGYVGFSSAPNTFDFSVTTNASGQDLASGDFAFFGVVAHEFSEIMGRQMNFGMNYDGGPGDGSGYDPLDLFDYASSGSRSFDASASNRYFSINGGVTDLGDFNTDPSGDLFDWSSSVANDAFDAFANPGVDNAVSANDLTLMNVLGYEPITTLAASAASLSGESLTFKIDNTSGAAAAASTAGVYAGAANTTPTTADTLLATYATPALAAGASVTATIALPLSHLAPGFYSLAVIPDSNASGATSNVTQIGIADNANIPTAAQGGTPYLFDFGGLDLSANGYVASLYIAASLAGAGRLDAMGGTLSFAPGASLTIATMDVSSSQVVIDTNLIYAGTWNGASGPTAIAKGDTLTFTGKGDVIGGPVQGGGTLALSGGGHLNLAIPFELSVADVDESGASTAEVSGSGLVSLSVWDQSAGTLSVDKGARAVLEGSGSTFAGTLTGAGVVAFTHGSATLDGATLSAASMAIDGPAMTLEGTITLKGELNATTGGLIVAAAGATLTGGGTLNLTNTATNRLYGAVDKATLTNLDDRISGAGDLGDGEVVLINDAAGVIDGDYADGLTINAGGATIANLGVIEATGKATVTIISPIDNSGRLIAAAGDMTVEGAVTGAGEAVVSAGTLDVAGTFSQNVAFGPTGVLELAHARTYAGKITGFSTAGTTSLDLGDIAFGASTKATFAGTKSSGVLTVADGSEIARITLVGDYLASTFALTSDGHGGTSVTDPAAGGAARLAAAMAGFAKAPAPSVARAAEPGRAERLVLAAPTPYA